MDKKLHGDSPATEVMSSLREAVMTTNIEGLKISLSSRIETITQNELAKSHVFDFGRLLDFHHPDFIKIEHAESLLERSRTLQSSAGLFLPHENSTFILRRPVSEINTWGIFVHFARQYFDSICVHVLQRTGKSPWLLFGSSEIQRHEDRSQLFCNRKDNKSDRLMTQIVVSDPLACMSLLTLKQDMVTVEPASWYYANEPIISDPKPFQIRNPVVGIVRVNQPRMFRQPSNSGPTGRKMRPHDRRSHLRHLGNKIIIVRESKPNGGAPLLPNGAPQPTIKIVQYERD